VLEVAFEGLARSSRHKSGIAMRFPRISRLRWDKPPREADRLESLERMLKADANHTPMLSTELDADSRQEKAPG
jgi:DNA ligase-1